MEPVEEEPESAPDEAGAPCAPLLPAFHEKAVKHIDAVALRLQERYGRGPERLVRILVAARAVGEFCQEPVCSLPVLLGWARLQAASGGLAVDHLPARPKKAQRRRMRFSCADIAVHSVGSIDSIALLDALSDRDLAVSCGERGGE